MKRLCLVLVCALGTAPLPARDKPPAVYTIPLPPRPDYSALEWLIGEWAGSTAGGVTQGSIHLSVEFALDSRFLILREEVELPATAAAPATRESWMGVLSASRSDNSFFLRMFSSTGFITRYRLTVEGREIDFSPEGGEQPPSGWLFRRILERSGEGEFKETVQVAPPQKPFFDYYTAQLTRAPRPARTAPPSP